MDALRACLLLSGVLHTPECKCFENSLDLALVELTMPCSNVSCCSHLITRAVEEANAFAVKKGKSGVKSWAANADLFPCEVSAGALDKARATIKVIRVCVCVCVPHMMAGVR